MRHGFSLVELSIVLVILGLLTGGILTGQNLIRAAELRSVTTQIDGYRAAAYTFRDKYFAIPGDMRNATSFWGAAHATPGTCLSTVGTGTQTCDGNGDGILGNAPVLNQYGEIFTFWQHLANAGLIEGTYTGRAGPSHIQDVVANQNVPNSKISGGIFLTRYASDTTVDGASLFAGKYGNLMYLGADLGTNIDGDNAVISASEMWNIDTKLDDGRPAYGRIVSYTNAYRTTCASTDVGSTAEYMVDGTVKGCSFIFKLGI